MTKLEMIERYGIEWYERQKQKSIETHRSKEYTEYCRKFHANKYKDPEIKKRRQEQNRTYSKERYVLNGRIDLVENYELAKHDNFKGWCLHHKLELHPDCSERFSKSSLLKLNLYYHRPANELIWLTSKEHRRIHTKYGIKK